MPKTQNVIDDKYKSSTRKDITKGKNCNSKRKMTKFKFEGQTARLKNGLLLLITGLR